MSRRRLDRKCLYSLLLAFAFTLAAAAPLRADAPADTAAKPADAKPADGKAADAKSAPQPTTIANPLIDPGDLKLLLEPLSRPELEVEASGWFGLLRAKVHEVTEAELAVRRKNREIVALGQVKDAAQKVAAASAVAEKKAASAPPDSDEAKAAAAKLAEANAKLEKSVESSKKEAAAPPAGTTPAAPAPSQDPAKAAAPAAPPVADDKQVMERAVESAQKKADKTGDDTKVVDKTVAASKETQASQDVAKLAEQAPAAAAQSAPPAVKAAETADTAKTLAAKVDEAAAAKSDVKVQLIDYSTQLGNERTEITDRLKLVLDNWDLKGGDSKDIRTYIAAVGGLKLDVSDKTATIARIKSWLVADEGGLRVARNIGLFLAYLLGSVILARIVRVIANRVMAATSHGPSLLLRRFLVDMSGRAIVFVGFLAGLSALEVNLAPLLAIIGAAGFVVAFALQGTLSNFASGLMIMLNRPFDVNDRVVVSGDIKGTVSAVSIFSTLIRTEDGKTSIVPNNSIWGGVIVNETTGVTTQASEPESTPAA